MQRLDVRRKPVHPEITEAMIETLVRSFYGRVRGDQELDAVFAPVIGAGWNRHLQKMCSFWSSVMLLTGRYKGKPALAHSQLEVLEPRHFKRWLALWALTAYDVCPPEVALAFMAKAERMAESFQRALAIKVSVPKPNAFAEGERHVAAC